MKCLGLHNKPTAEVHPGHKLTGPKEEEEEEEEEEGGGGGGGEEEEVRASAVLLPNAGNYEVSMCGRRKWPNGRTKFLQNSLIGSRSEAWGETDRHYDSYMPSCYAHGEKENVIRLR
jgi:hypothetical protein